VRLSEVDQRRRNLQRWRSTHRHVAGEVGQTHRGQIGGAFAAYRFVERVHGHEVCAAEIIERDLQLQCGRAEGTIE
jgi:hypothetical protein